MRRPTGALDPLVKEIARHSLVDLTVVNRGPEVKLSSRTTPETAMLRNVLLKTIRDQRRSYAAWCAGVVLLVAMYVALWPSIKGQPSMQDFLDQMPPAFRNLFAMSGADMSTPVGYIQVELLSFMGPVLVLLYAIGIGSSAVAGEQDRGTLELLLTTPASRGRVLVDKAIAMAVGHWACRPCSALPSSSRAPWRRWVCRPARSPRPCCIWDCSGSSSAPWPWRSGRGPGASDSAVPSRSSWPCSPTSSTASVGSSTG